MAKRSWGRNKRRGYVAATAVVALSAVGWRASPVDARPEPASTAPTTRPTTAPAAEAIVVGERVRVQVFGVTGPGSVDDFVVRVDADGTVRLPFVGRVTMAGLNPSAASAAVDRAYVDGNVLPNSYADVMRLDDRAERTGRPAPPLAAGEIVTVQAVDLLGPGLLSNFERRITASGRVRLPYVGDVEVAGLTESQAADRIVDAMSKANVLPNAIIVVMRGGPTLDMRIDEAVRHELLRQPGRRR